MLIFNLDFQEYFIALNTSLFYFEKLHKLGSRFLNLEDCGNKSHSQNCASNGENHACVPTKN